MSAQSISAQDNLADFMRPAAVVMDVTRLGCLYPYPLSFMRSLLRRVMTHNWKITPARVSLNDEGYGHVVYEVTTPSSVFSYVIFSKKLDASSRSDRVIACLLYTSPSPRDQRGSRMPSSA